MTYQLLGSVLRVSLLTLPNETEGGVFLPEISVGRVFDGEVLDAGPGCTQARPGDRVIFTADADLGAPTDFPEGQRLVREAGLAAVLPGPDCAEIVPARDRVTAIPLPAEESPLVYGHSMGGGKAQDFLRGRELLHEYRAYRERWAAASEPLDEQVLKATRWGRSLSGRDKQALQAALDDEQQQDRDYRCLVPLWRPGTPRAALLQRVGAGVNGSLGSAPAGARLWFDREYRAVQLSAGGGGLFVVKASEIAVVED